MSRPATDARERLLTAAEDIVLARGCLQLTLDAVAAAAGVSKGGLLYHFRSKEALITALVEGFVTDFAEDFADALKAEPDAPGRCSRAMIRAAENTSDSETEHRRERVGAAILAAASSDPALLAPIRDAYTKFIRRVDSDGLVPGVPLVITAALDGFFFWKLFGLHAPSKRALRNAVAVLRQLTQPTQ